GTHIMLSQVVAALFFFFQAEDGIRDYKVTGVQTCALPISSISSHLVRPVHEGDTVRWWRQARAAARGARGTRIAASSRTAAGRCTRLRAERLARGAYTRARGVIERLRRAAAATHPAAALEDSAGRVARSR